MSDNMIFLTCLLAIIAIMILVHFMHRQAKKEILRVLKKNGGEMSQAEIVREANWTVTASNVDSHINILYKRGSVKPRLARSRRMFNTDKPMSHYMYRIT